MTKEEQKKEAVVEQPKEEAQKQVAIKDVPTDKLKAIAFDLQQQRKFIDNQYQTVYNEIAVREAEVNQK